MRASASAFLTPAESLASHPHGIRGLVGPRSTTMVFSSVTFLFLFLPIVLGLYHLLLLPWTLGSRRRI